MNKLILSLFLAFCGLRGCSQKSNLYYLSIGNGYYKNMADVPSAILSAKVVGSYLNKYGKGSILVSKNDTNLSLDTLENAIKQVINTASSDTSAVVFLYYCGHGQNDEKNDNLFFLPSIINLKDSLVNKQYLTKQLLNIRDIQAEFLGRIIEKKQSDEDFMKLVLAVMLGYSASQTENLPSPFNAQTQAEKIERQKYKDMKDSLLNNLKMHIPRLIIFADCCNENFNINPAQYKNYPHPTIEEIKKIQDTASMVYQGLGYLIDSVMNTPEYFLDLIGNTARNIYYSFGNKVVYNKDKNVAVKTVMFFDKTQKSYIKVGPIAHRLLTYLSIGKKYFTTLELLQKLIDPQFDIKIDPCYFETESISIKKKVDQKITIFDAYNFDEKIFKN